MHSYCYSCYYCCWGVNYMYRPMYIWWLYVAVTLIHDNQRGYAWLHPLYVEQKSKEVLYRKTHV